MSHYLPQVKLLTVSLFTTKKLLIVSLFTTNKNNYLPEIRKVKPKANCYDMCLQWTYLLNLGKKTQFKQKQEQEWKQDPEQEQDTRRSRSKGRGRCRCRSRSKSRVRSRSRSRSSSRLGQKTRYTASQQNYFTYIL